MFAQDTLFLNITSSLFIWRKWISFPILFTFHIWSTTLWYFWCSLHERIFLNSQFRTMLLNSIFLSIYLMNLDFGCWVLLTFLHRYRSLYPFRERRWTCIWCTNSSWSFRKITSFNIDSIDDLGLFTGCGWWIIVLIYVVGVSRIGVRVSRDWRGMRSVILSAWA